jgi:hypothetical protein
MSRSHRLAEAINGLCGAILIACFPLDAQQGQSAEHTDDFATEALQEDFQVLRSALEEGHPGLYRYSSKEEMDRQLDELGSRISEPMSELEYFQIISLAIAGVNDGHTRATASQKLTSWLNSSPFRLPFKLQFLGESAYLHRNYSDLDDSYLGARVVAINGTPMTEIVEAMLPLLSSDGRVVTSRYRQLDRTSVFGPLYTLVFGPTTRFELLLEMRSGEKETIAVDGLNSSQLARRFQARYPEKENGGPPIEFEIRDGVAILTVRTFGGGAYGSAGINYAAFLEDAFGQIGDGQIRDLIIDVRDNGGGSDAFGKMLFAHLTDQAFDYYESLQINNYKFEFQRYTNSPDREIPESQRRPNDSGTYDLLGHPNLGTQQPQTPGFDGRVYVLQNGSSFSATGEFTSVLHYNRGERPIVFIGEEGGSGYYGNVSGMVVTLTLPNTGIRVNLPLVKYSMAVSGYRPTDRGLVPDQEVTPTIDDVLADRDVVLEYAIALARKAGAGG